MKYSPEKIQEICGYLKDGLKREDACTLADIALSTFYEWMHESEFSDAIKKAELHTKQANIKIILNTAKKNWFAAAWWLERKFKDEFSLKQEVEHGGKMKLEHDDIRSLIAALPADKQQTFYATFAQLVEEATRGAGEASTHLSDDESARDLPDDSADVSPHVPS